MSEEKPPLTRQATNPAKKAKTAEKNANRGDAAQSPATQAQMAGNRHGGKGKDAVTAANGKNVLAARGGSFFANPAIRRYLPISDWLPQYRRADLPGDVTAGIIVAIMLIPQGMAYALLAGLPAQTGLYASMLPLVLYAIFGTSRALAVGPVAIVSLMVASALAPMAELGSAQYAGYALVLALLSGLFLTLLGLLRIGFIVNFLSHPVVAGFVSAAALIIGFSQFKHLLGISLERTHFIPTILLEALRKATEVNGISLLISAAAILLLVKRDAIGRALARMSFMESRQWSGPVRDLLPKAMPLIVAILGTVLVWLFALDKTAGVAIVADIPAGLPGLTLPSFDAALWGELLPAAMLISVVGFLESISVARSLASKKRQKVIANQELIGLGMANIAAAATGGYPVTGGFSRSVVNYNAGANTPLAAIITAVIIAIVVLLFTPALYYLPKAVLAAVIVVAVATLLDFKAFRDAWNYSKIDGFSYVVTFLGVLTFGVETGIVIGIAVSLGLHLWRTSIPHMAIVGRLNDTEHFRNIERHGVTTYDNVLLIRVDESLYFANTAYLEDQLLRYVADHSEVEHLVLICSAVNAIDASALDTLEHLAEELKDGGVTLHFSEVKGPVMDRLRKSDFLYHLKPGRVFLTTHEAVETLTSKARRTAPERASKSAEEKVELLQAKTAAKSETVTKLNGSEADDTADQRRSHNKKQTGSTMNEAVKEVQDVGKVAGIAGAAASGAVAAAEASDKKAIAAEAAAAAIAKATGEQPPRKYKFVGGFLRRD